MRRSLALSCLLVLLVAGVAQAQEAPAGEYSELEKLVRSFRDATVRGGFVVASDPEVVSPFGGPTQLPPEITGPVTVTGTVDVIANARASSGAAPPPFPLDSPTDGWLRPRPFEDTVTPYDLGDVNDGGVDGAPAVDFPDFTAEDAAIVLSGPISDPFRTAGPADTTFTGGPVLIDGGTVASPIPLDCPGQTIEYGRVDLINGQPAWQGFAENDLFNGGSQAFVTRCVDGQWQLERLVNQGDQFVPMATNAFSVIFEEGWLTFIPLEELQGSTGNRHFGFVTTNDNPFQPETTGSTATPFPSLAPNSPHVLLTDPERYLTTPPVFSGPGLLEFFSGTCPPESWQSVYDISADGSRLHMEQLSSGQVVSGEVAPGDPTWALEGSGPGFAESYEWDGPAGTYTYTTSDLCTWEVSMDPLLYEEVQSALAAGSPETATSTTPDTTTTTALSPTSTTTIAAEGGDQGSSLTSLWPWALVVAGLLALGLGGLFLFGAKDPCDELRKAWEAAEQRRKTVDDALEQARQYLKERRGRVGELEAELEKLESAAGSSVTEHGVTYHMIEGGRVTSEGLQSLTDATRGSLADARAAEADAQKSVKEWEQRAHDAELATAEAKSAYERCRGERAPETAESPGEPAPISAGPVAAEASVAEPAECTSGDTEVRPAGNPESVQVTVDFSIFVEVMEGSGRNVEAGKTLAVDLSDLAGSLGTLGSLLGAYGSGRSVGQGVFGLQAGKYTLAGGKLLRGGVEGYIAGADPNIGTESFPISIPTSPQEAATEFLEATARLGALVAGKVTEWMEMNQLLRIRMTYFYQTLTAAPHQVWVCENGRWVCQEQIYEITVGSLQRRPGPQQGPFRLESDIARQRFEQEVQNMTRRGRSEIETSVRRRVEFEQAHQPGPCQ